MLYLVLKYIHILSATILFGTGLGTAFFMLMAYLSKSIEAIKVTTRTVVIADTIFTLPTVIIQPVSGYLLMQVLNYQLNTLWFLTTMSLYVLAGICWVRVVFIQFRMKALSQDVKELPEIFHKLMREWILLGCVAFFALVIVYQLMVFKTGLSYMILGG